MGDRGPAYQYEQSLKEFFSPNVFPGRRMECGASLSTEAPLLATSGWCSNICILLPFMIVPHQAGACILSNPSKNEKNATIRRHSNNLWMEKDWSPNSRTLSFSFYDLKRQLAQYLPSCCWLSTSSYHSFSIPFSISHRSRRI